MLMKKRWLQVLVHSCIYYRLNKNLVSDKKWDSWARELYALVQKYPGIAKSMPYPEALLNFNPATGFDLPLQEPWVLSQAQYLIEIDHRMKSVIRIDFGRKK